MNRRRGHRWLTNLALLPALCVPTSVGAATLPSHPWPVSTLTWGGRHLKTVAGELVAPRPVPTTGAIRIVRWVAGVDRPFVTITGPGWHALWAWQSEGPYLALWIGELPSSHPDTADFTTTIVLLDLTRRTVRLETVVAVNDVGYLTGPYLVVSGPWGAQELRRALWLYDLAAGTEHTLVTGPNVAAGPLLVRGKVCVLVYPSRHSARPVVQVQPLPTYGWSRWRGDHEVRIVFAHGRSTARVASTPRTSPRAGGAASRP